MTNIDNIRSTHLDKEEKSNRTTTKVVIITSIDDDNEKILSYFNPSNVQTFVVDLNKTNLMDAYQIDKRSLSQLEHATSIDESKTTHRKRRKADLTCVVCGGQAIGYNFSQITCESCKAFFRRNGLHPIENAKCIKDKNNFSEVQCDVRHDVKHKCQRCRLLKCFQKGMRKDYILTPEEKKVKQKRLEDNRRLRTRSVGDHIKNEAIIEPLTNPTSDISPIDSLSLLNDSDWSCLSYIQNAYLSASQSTPPTSSMISTELTPDRMSAFMNTFDIQNFVAVKLINFIRTIPEFDQLDERDRLILVKYNLTILFLIRHSLTFDSVREVCYDLDTNDAVSPTDEAFAQHCKSLFILCYGYEFNRMVMSILHVLVNIVNKDPIIVQLLMLIIIFSKGLSADDEQEPILIDEQRVYQAQTKYTDLLFRYLMQQSSYEVVAMKITRITEQILKIQKVLRDFQQHVKNKIDVTHINPLMKSLLHLT